MRDVDASQISGRLLRVFITVYDEMSVSKAAERLETSQSTVSHTLEKLRSIIGDKLFLPSGRGIVPSARAERLAPKVRRLLAQMDALLDTGDYAPLEDPEPFVIATNGGILVPQVDKICNAIWQDLPAKRMVFRELGSRGNAEHLLDSGEADFVITPRPASYPASLRHAYLFSDAFRVFYDPQIRRPIRNVLEYSGAHHATLDFGGTAKSIVQCALDDQDLSRTVTVSVPNVWALAEVIRGSDMIATLPAILKASAFRGLAHCDLPLNIPAANFDLVWHKRFDDSSRLHWLRDKLISLLAETGG
ncbi:LysR family transcriptional regulator [Phaeobacter sp. QD34_3]|uniref:LysR family transcriptional regulator n=1 Tax=unclassified Phaeobacter TaxID=2621772 RepID=UPI00237F85EE|nr:MULTISPECIES: LysR family transcriptional regulator [unclassified Phaeobacter]MDE4134430.1 LysR family transcriptional regulator [Phaeobacter sp. QD34_3]MDE4138077.1 LysR family transcriptional regulator [Phaeobacter sp. QD34_24]MDE4173946.1 LysR family transcriptional regulator [Phaeobacter sp. PT47_59]